MKSAIKMFTFALCFLVLASAGSAPRAGGVAETPAGTPDQAREAAPPVARAGAPLELSDEDRPPPYLDKRFKREFDIDNAPSKGADDAELTLVAFVDFQCPYCKIYADAADAIVEEFSYKVRIVYLNFPLHKDCNDSVSTAFHGKACVAAAAALAAHEEGRFWDMRDYLFKNPHSLARENIVSFAERSGMNEINIGSAIDNDRYEERLRSEARQMAAAGGRGTPTVFVNGHMVINGPWDDKEKSLEFIGKLLEE